MIYTLFYFIFKIVIKLRFKSVYLNNYSLLASQQPLIIIANHGNSFLDAILLAIVFKRELHFLARADVFNSKFKWWFLGKLNMMPIYRIRDGREALKNNDVIFSKCTQILKKSGAILIFPEGNCVVEKRLRSFKTGFVNLAFESDVQDLAVLPISLNYSSLKTLNTDVDVFFNNLINTVERQNNRLQNIIDQVMSNSLGFEEIELQKEKLKPHSLLKSIISDFNLAYPTIGIQTIFDQSEIALTLDKFHLTTAVTNVLENAVKYGCNNITISTKNENGHFQISIQDDGIGISKQKQHLLFEKFYRVEQGNLHNTKGLGLGLYYVDQIVKAHKGSVNVMSELGKGASFTISLPTV